MSAERGHGAALERAGSRIGHGGRDLSAMPGRGKRHVVLAAAAASAHASPERIQNEGTNHEHHHLA